VVGPIVKLITEDDLEAKTGVRGQLGHAAGVQNPWVRRRKIELADLIDEPWCMPPPDSTVGSRCVGAVRNEGNALHGLPVRTRLWQIAGLKRPPRAHHGAAFVCAATLVLGVMAAHATNGSTWWPAITTTMPHLD